MFCHFCGIALKMHDYKECDGKTKEGVRYCQPCGNTMLLISQDQYECLYCKERRRKEWAAPYGKEKRK